MAMCRRACTQLRAGKTRMPLYRYVQFTPPKPHLSLHGPTSLSDYLSNHPVPLTPANDFLN